jgi:carbamoyl-phosphate synthase small subunit
MKRATLILDDGTQFVGWHFGFPFSTSGEVVFQTGMVGYPEALTDPSYAFQILVLTYPLIGNYGVPPSSKNENDSESLPCSPYESSRIHVAGLIVQEYVHDHSHWSATRSLDEWLREEHVPGISGIDTRRLTKLLREGGSRLGKIVLEGDDPALVPSFDPNHVDIVSRVCELNLSNSNKQSLSKTVNGDASKTVNGDSKSKLPFTNRVYHPKGTSSPLLRVLVIDCGIKLNQIRCFINRGVTVTRVPYDADFVPYLDRMLLSSFA